MNTLSVFISIFQILI